MNARPLRRASKRHWLNVVDVAERGGRGASKLGLVSTVLARLVGVNLDWRVPENEQCAS